jgi:hypothetical protein
MVSPLTTQPDHMQCYNLGPGVRMCCASLCFEMDKSTFEIPASLVTIWLILTGAVRDGAERKIYLAADTRVRNRDVEVVLDQIRIAGISKVAILTN